MEPKRTPGKAEGTEEDADNALQAEARKREAGASAAQKREDHAQSQEPGRTPGKAEGPDGTQK